MPLSCATDLLAGGPPPRRLSTVCDAAHHPFLEPRFRRDAARSTRIQPFIGRPVRSKTRASLSFSSASVSAGSTRAMRASLWTPTHMLPFSRKAIPPNIFLLLHQSLLLAQSFADQLGELFIESHDAPLGRLPVHQPQKHPEQRELHCGCAALDENPGGYGRDCVLPGFSKDDVRREKRPDRPREHESVADRRSARVERGEQKGEDCALDQHGSHSHGDHGIRSHDRDRRIVPGVDREMGGTLYAKRGHDVSEDGEEYGGGLPGLHEWPPLSGRFRSGLDRPDPEESASNRWAKTGHLGGGKKANKREQK